MGGHGRTSVVFDEIESAVGCAKAKQLRALRTLSKNGRCTRFAPAFTGASFCAPYELFPGRAAVAPTARGGAARSDALQTRDRNDTCFGDPASAVHRSRAAPRSGHNQIRLNNAPARRGALVGRHLIRISNSPPYSRERMRSEVCGTSPSRGEGGGAPRRRWCGIRRTSWPASRSGRSPFCRRLPVHDADRRASRRSTAAISVLGPRFSSGHLLSRPVRQPAPGGALVVTPKWSPEGLPGPGVRDLCAGAAPLLHQPNASGRRPQ